MPGRDGGARSRCPETPVSRDQKRDARQVDQRLSLVTLGVADIERARTFYEALGWSGESPDGEVVFFQTPGMIVALWGRERLAEDSAVPDGGGWGGVTLAYNAPSPEEVEAVLVEAETAGATIARAGAATFWGGYSGVFIDPDGHPFSKDDDLRIVNILDIKNFGCGFGPASDVTSIHGSFPNLECFVGTVLESLSEAF